MAIRLIFLNYGTRGLEVTHLHHQPRLHNGRKASNFDGFLVTVGANDP